MILPETDFDVETNHLYLLQGNFKLQIEEGEFTDSEIIVMLGENGTGKTTFIRMIHGSIDPDDPDDKEKIPQFNVSYKPQKISPKFPGSVSFQLSITCEVCCRVKQEKVVFLHDSHLRSFSMGT